jgi:hypothetical protein
MVSIFSCKTNPFLYQMYGIILFGGTEFRSQHLLRRCSTIETASALKCIIVLLLEGMHFQVWTLWTVRLLWKFVGRKNTWTIFEPEIFICNPILFFEQENVIEFAMSALFTIIDFGVRINSKRIVYMCMCVCTCTCLLRDYM